MFSRILSAVVRGIESDPVYVEADVSNGLPIFEMVGNLASEVKEAGKRVRTALKNSGIMIPAKRITVNLSPGDIRKEGSAFDLPVAAAVLLAFGYGIQEMTEQTLIIGELGLDGSVHPVTGVLSVVSKAKELGCRYCIVPAENAKEGAVIKGIKVIGIGSIKELVEYLEKRKEAVPESINIEEILSRDNKEYSVDFYEVNGQEGVKRATEVAAAGFHNLLYIGPPGSGKTMMAKRIITILPEPTLEESLEISKIYSISGFLPPNTSLIVTRPFRAPHHTITPTSLAGGGKRPKPGEISLANNGVLFLDELSEFSKAALEVMRQPMEDHEIHIARLSGTYSYPANVMLVAAMNPCPCGYYPDMNKCNCTPWEIKRYLNKISHPLLDRIDICIEAPRVEYKELISLSENESSKTIRERVINAHNIQKKRYQGRGIRFNSNLSAAGVKEYCKLNREEADFVERVFEKLELSARAYHRMLKVARTIADLDNSPDICIPHLSEAICYRSMNKKQENI